VPTGRPRSRRAATGSSSFSGSNGSTLAGNLIANNVTGVVIAVGSSNNTISGGVIRDNRGEGIRVGGDAAVPASSANRLVGGSVTANGGKGINL